MLSHNKLAFGQVPVLSVDDDLHLVQSHAILRYLGRIHGFYVGSVETLANVDVIADGKCTTPSL